MRALLICCLLLLSFELARPSTASSSDWPDATPTAWHQLARAESLLSAPEPPNPVAVCIVDSGVNLTPDLAPVVIERLAYDGGDPGDTYPQEGIDDGHGTYVATFLAGQVNGWGGAGLWPRAKIVSVRVFPPGGKRATASAYLEGLSACVRNPLVKVINLSLGGVNASPTELAEMQDRISDYRRSDSYNIVAAAGNRGGGVEFPARFHDVLAVGAAAPTGRLCAFSARGPELDISAPGCELDGADGRGGAAKFSGTSFSAPLVSAALAALRTYGGLGAKEAEAKLLAASAPGPDGQLLDARTSLAGLLDASSRQSNTPIDSQTLSSNERTNGDFVEYPAPRVRVRRGRNPIVEVLNRPRGASTEIRHGRKTRELRRSRWRADTTKSLHVRFVSDAGFSRWSLIHRSRLRRKSS